MSDATELVFGFLLWLVSCVFIFNLYNNQAKFQPQLNKQKSPNSFDTDNLSEEKIQVLLEQLEAKSHELELLQDKSSQLETQLRQENKEFQAKIIDLEKEYQQLKTKLIKQSQELKADFQDTTFEQLHFLFTNYPTAKVMVKVKPNLPAKNLVALFKPLDTLLTNWDFHPIGKPWQKVAYNPQLHQADSENIKRGELVYVRFIGYRHGDRIICPAKVSRTLPGTPKK